MSIICAYAFRDSVEGDAGAAARPTASTAAPAAPETAAAPTAAAAAATDTGARGRC